MLPSRNNRLTLSCAAISIFAWPPALIAENPVRPWDAARLPVVGAAALEDHRAPDLPALLRMSDPLVSTEMR